MQLGISRPPTSSIPGETTFIQENRRLFIKSALVSLQESRSGRDSSRCLAERRGKGKTDLTMQLVIDAPALSPDLKALVCNVAMSPPIQLDRQRARLAAIDGTLIRHRRLTAEHAGAVERGV